MVKRVLYRAASRLATLPQSHPLSKHVSRAAKRYVKSHRAPMHEILHAFNVQPTRFETITLCSRSPKWHPPFSVHVSKSKADAVGAADTSHADTVVYSDGSGQDGQIGAGAMLFRNGVERATLRKHLGTVEHHMVFEAELLGMSLAAELVRVERHVWSVIFRVDSQVAITTIKQSKVAPGQYLVDALHDQLAAVRLRHPGIEVEVRWMPGNTGVVGNERADEEAKRAATGDSTGDPQLPAWCRKTLPVSRSAARQERRVHEFCSVE